MQDQTTAAEQLKRSTASAHAQTEKALIRYVKQVSSVEEYAWLLGCLYGYYQPMEAHFDRYLTQIIPQYAERRKSESILRDLETMEYAVPKRFARQLPVMKDPVSALGCFYVLEGSVLGAAVMKKMIGTQCPQIPATAFSFLSGYADTMNMWRSFLMHLNSALQTEQELDTAIAAANDCFTQFGNWIDMYYQAKSPA